MSRIWYSAKLSERVDIMPRKKDKRLRKIHKDILLNHNYTSQNWWLVDEDNNYFDISHKTRHSIRRFSKLDKSEIIIREMTECKNGNYNSVKDYLLMQK